MLSIQTCYKSLLVATFCTTILAPNISSAAGITNGDFQTGDFTGWSQDTDGGGSPILGLNDFSIVEPTTGNNAAQIEIDYFETPGDFMSPTKDEAFSGNTLYQELDLTASAGQALILSFDWLFSGEANISDENFLVALGFIDPATGDLNHYDQNMTLGSLLSPTTYGSGTYTTMLDSSFANATGWTLEFQMNLVGFDGFGSHAIIDNVSLTTVSPLINKVPEPAVIWLMGLGLIGLAKVQRNKKVT